MAAKRKSNREGGLGRKLVLLLLLAGVLLGGWFYYQHFYAPKRAFTWNEASNVISNLTRRPVPPRPAEGGTTQTVRQPKVDPGPVAPRPLILSETNLVAKPGTTNAVETKTNGVAAELVKREWRGVTNILDAQIALHRRGISVGCIDGQEGAQTRTALEVFQIYNQLGISGILDNDTKSILKVQEPLFTSYTVTESDLTRLMTVPESWVAKAELPRLDYETLLEYVAEKFCAYESFIRKLNPEVDWKKVTPGTVLKVPRVDRIAPRKAAFARIHVYSKTMAVFDAQTNLLAHFPCSIAKRVDKRPIGLVTVTKAAWHPTYLFDPELFQDSPEARTIKRKLTIPAGPNNPVGNAWVGLDRPGYGIHGTPKPEQVGRTESLGCFRLANWNAEYFLQMTWVGMPVYVQR